GVSVDSGWCWRSGVVVDDRQGVGGAELHGGLGALAGVVAGSLVEDRELALLRHRKQARRLALADGVALAQVAVDRDAPAVGPGGGGVVGVGAELVVVVG